MSALRAAAAGLLCLALLATAARAQPGLAAEWQRYRSQPGRFTVDLPGTPRISRREEHSLVGEIASVEYLVELGDLELRVEHHDVPTLARWFVSESGLLARAQEDLVQGEQARVLQAEELRSDGRLLREVRYRQTAPDGRDGRAHLLMLGNRLYVLAALYPRGSGGDPALERFFGSFEVWER